MRLNSMDFATQLPETWQRAAIAAYQRHGQRLPVLAAVVLALRLRYSPVVLAGAAIATVAALAWHDSRSLLYLEKVEE